MQQGRLNFTFYTYLVTTLTYFIHLIIYIFIYLLIYLII